MKRTSDLLLLKDAIDFASRGGAKATPAYEPFAERICGCKDRESDALYQIALTLSQAKNELEHGMFLAFLRDQRVNIKPRMAQNLMQLARAEDGRDLAKLGIAKALQMLRVDIDRRRWLFIRHSVEHLSVAELRRLLNNLLGTQGCKRRASSGLRTSPEVIWAAGVLHFDLPPVRITACSVDLAFRSLARVLHPDRGLAADGTFFRTLVRARDILEKAMGALPDGAMCTRE